MTSTEDSVGTEAEGRSEPQNNPHPGRGELLPCPFCGGRASVCVGEHAFNDAIVRCAGCSAEGPVFDIDDGDADETGRNKADAIAAWNRRAHPAPYKVSSAWILEQAQSLSGDKSDDAVGALAWNLSVFVTRLQALQYGREDV